MVSALPSNPKVGVQTRLEEKVFFAFFILSGVEERTWRLRVTGGEGVGVTVWAPLVKMQFAHISVIKHSVHTHT